MTPFSIKSPSFHLYEAFKKEAEDMGWKFYGTFSKNDMEYFCLVFNFDGEFYFGFGKMPYPTVFHLPAQWDEAIAFARDQIKPEVEIPKKAYSNGTCIHFFEGQKHIARAVFDKCVKPDLVEQVAKFYNDQHLAKSAVLDTIKQEPEVELQERLIAHNGEIWDKDMVVASASNFITHRHALASELARRYNEYKKMREALEKIKLIASNVDVINLINSALNQKP